MSDELELATTTELIDELAKRFPHGLLVSGLRPVKENDHQESCETQWRHGLTACIGLAERARLHLTQLTAQNQTEAD